MVEGEKALQTKGMVLQVQVVGNMYNLRYLHAPFQYTLFCPMLIIAPPLAGSTYILYVPIECHFDYQHPSLTRAHAVEDPSQVTGGGETKNVKFGCHKRECMLLDNLDYIAHNNSARAGRVVWHVEEKLAWAPWMLR